MLTRFSENDPEIERITMEGIGCLNDALTVKEAAGFCGVHYMTMQRWIALKDKRLIWRKTTSGVLIYKASLYAIYPNAGK